MKRRHKNRPLKILQTSLKNIMYLQCSFWWCCCILHFLLLMNHSAKVYRAMAVLVAASPCALAISTPSAVLSGVARAARGGVLVKGGRPLEELGSLTAIAFDKTGTLTEGKPKLTGVYPLNGTNEDKLLETV